MIRASIDESGTHENAVLCVAVVAGTSTQWRKWERVWYPIVQADLGSVGRYHAKSHRCGELNTILAGLLWRHMDLAHAFIVSDPDYRAHMRQDKRSFYGSAYTIGIQAGLTAMGRYYHAKKLADLVIEKGHANQGGAQEFLQGVLLRGVAIQRRYCLRSVRWVGKEDAAIHPADLVSHEVSAHWPERSELLSVLQNKLTITHFGPDEIQALSAGLPHPAYFRKRRANPRN